MKKIWFLMTVALALPIVSLAESNTCGCIDNNDAPLTYDSTTASYVCSDGSTPNYCGDGATCTTETKCVASYPGCIDVSYQTCVINDTSTPCLPAGAWHSPNSKTACCPGYSVQSGYCKPESSTATLTNPATATKKDSTITSLKK